MQGLLQPIVAVGHRDPPVPGQNDLHVLRAAAIPVMGPVEPHQGVGVGGGGQEFIQNLLRDYGKFGFRNGLCGPPGAPRHLDPNLVPFEFEALRVWILLQHLLQRPFPLFLLVFWGRGSAGGRRCHRCRTGRGGLGSNLAIPVPEELHPLLQAAVPLAKEVLVLKIQHKGLIYLLDTIGNGGGCPIHFFINQWQPAIDPHSLPTPHLSDEVVQPPKIDRLAINGWHPDVLVPFSHELLVLLVPILLLPTERHVWIPCIHLACECRLCTRQRYGPFHRRRLAT
mmetsp:Transcript_141128/g.246028  ORF Transcript_141128/g.246028 Transcript_141128/m.246028 type:complete len:282 (+) Transcript_141128:1173-2018(+)